MFDDCQPVFIDNLYGSLTINTNDSSSCIEPRQWIFSSDYGYILFIRLINLTQLFSQSYLLRIFSIINQQKLLIYDSTNTTIVNNEIQFNIREKYSSVVMELIATKKINIQQTSFMIDYVFREASQSRYGRQILQDNSSTSSSFNANQPSFIALICIIAALLIAIIITISVFCYRHCAYRRQSKKRYKIHDKCRQTSSEQQSTDQTHLAASITPSSASSNSIRSTRRLSSHHHHLMHIQQQTSSLGLSTSTLPTILPSRRLQQSMMDAYLNDYKSFQPNTIDPKQLQSYLFIDLYSTSSETFPDVISKQYKNDNTTTSGYDTSTGGEDRRFQNPMRYRHRRGYYYHQRQRRRSTRALKRSRGPRFLMRERSLPSNLIKLPQLRQDRHFAGIQTSQSSSTNSNTNHDFISTNASTTTDDYDESHAYHIQHSRTMNTIEEEEKPSRIQKSFSQKPYFFEMVSTSRGDDSDMPNYEDIRIPYKICPIRGDGIAYVNDSIIV